MKSEKQDVVKLYIVILSNYYPREIDSIWLDEQKAKSRAYVLGPEWKVEAIFVSGDGGIIL